MFNQPTTMLSTEQRASITQLLSRVELARGLGDEDSPCSIAAVNLALTGVLTDDIPNCMSRVVGHWIIIVQDHISSDVRNSAEWKELLPLAAGTGREHEEERLGVILDWMKELDPVPAFLRRTHLLSDRAREVRVKTIENYISTALDSSRYPVDRAYSAAWAVADAYSPWLSDESTGGIPNPCGTLRKLVEAFQ